MRLGEVRWQAFRGCSLAAAVLASCGAPPRRQAVVITIDTLRADHVGARRGGVPLTPSLDRLAVDAVVYRDTIANASLTLPSHASFFSGLYPWRHQVLSNKRRLGKHVPWVPVLLRERAFVTGAVVSSVAVQAAPSGLARGFVTYDDAFDGRELNRQAQHFKTPGLTTRSAVEWLRAHRGDDFFLWVHYQPPHGPYAPPAEYFEGLPPPAAGEVLPLGRSNLERDAIPEYQALGGERAAGAYRRAYAAHVRYTDHHVGRLLEALRELGIYRNALVVVTADHGESLGERGFYFCHGNLAYQEQVAIPLLVKRPGNRDAGRVVVEPVEGVDVAPTVLHELGLPGALETDGRCVVPERLVPGARRRYAQAQNMWEVAVYEGPLKLIVPLVPRPPHETAPAARALFDLALDPAETRDVSVQKREQADRLEAELRRLHAAAGAAPAAPLSPEHEEGLKALGYVD